MTKSADAFRTISEVAEWLDTPAHVLRFWESKFSQVKPVKRAGGRRYYRPSDMELLGGIKRLLHDDGMTIKGVQKLLRDKGVAHVAALSQPLDDVTQAVRDAMTARKSPDEGRPAEVVEGQVSPASGGADATPEVDPAAQVETLAEASPQPAGEPSEPEAEHTTDTPGDVPATPEGFVPFGKKPGDGEAVPIEAPTEPPFDSPAEAPAASVAPAPQATVAEEQAPAVQTDLHAAKETSPVESPPSQDSMSAREPAPVADAQPIQRPARDAVQAYAARTPNADVTGGVETGGDVPNADGVDMPGAIDASPAEAAQPPAPQDAGFAPQSKPGQDTRQEPPSIPTPLLAHICERDAPLSPGDIERAKELAGQLREWLVRQAG
jgi:DNA-binding transcriptional MerR regulator